MSVTLDALEDRVLRRLNEANNSAAPQFESGTSGTPTTTTAVGMRDHYNAVAAEIARTCLPIAGRATYTNYPAGTRSTLLTDFTPASGGEVWAVQQAQYGSTVLTYADFEVIRLYYSGGSGDVDFVANGTPAYWFRMGQDTIGLYPPPSGSSTTLTIAGLAVPAVGTSGSDTTAWLDDSLLEMLEAGIAAEVAAKNLEDASMAVRFELWREVYDSGRRRLWGRIPRQFREAFYPNEPGTERGLATVAGRGR